MLLPIVNLLGRASSSLVSTIKSRAQRNLVAYLVRRLLAAFLQNDLAEDELQIATGELLLTNLSLNTQTIDEHLHRHGFKCTAGQIDRLRLQVPWTDLRNGTLAIDLSGVSLSFTLCGPKAAAKDNATLDVEDELAALADSFVEDDEEVLSGVGDTIENLTGSIKDLLARWLAGLSVTLTNLEIVLDLGHRTELKLHIANVNSSVEKSVMSQRRLDVGLVTLSITDRGESWEITHRRDRSISSASDSSFSSAADDELLQSTIFGVQQSRSLYMSAMQDSTSMYESATEEQPRATRILLSCQQGISVVVEVVDGVLSVSAVVGAVRAAISRQDLLTLADLSSTIQTRFRSTQDPPLETDAKAVAIDAKLDSVEIAFGFSKVNSLDDLSHSDLRAEFTQLRYRLNQERLFASVSQIHLRTRDATLLTLKRDDRYALEITRQDIVSTLHLSSCAAQLDLDIPVLLNLQTELEQLLSALPRSAEADASSATNAPIVGSVLWHIDGMTIHARTNNDHLMTCILDTIETRYTNAEQHQRISIELAAATLQLANHHHDDHALLSITKPTVCDLTWPHPASTPPHSRRLHFIDFDKLFVKAERDEKADAETYQEVQTMARTRSQVVLRAVLGSVSCSLTPQKISRIQEIAFKVSALAATTRKSASPSTSSGLAVLIEVPQIELEISFDEWHLSCQVHKLNLFCCTRLQDLLICGIDLATCKASLAEGDVSQHLIDEGHHLHSQTSNKALSAVSLRFRQHLQTSESFCRIALRNTRLEYHADWLLPRFVAALQQTMPAQSAQNANAIPADRSLPIELTLSDFSIGLNPYVTATKGYLYLRRSLVSMSLVGQGLQSPPIVSNAGILELYLINNIDGGPNDITDSSKKRKDPVLSALSKLGFVQIAVAETVELKISSRPDGRLKLLLSGLILTLHTCADSTQTMINLLSMLRLPVEVPEALRYKLGLTADGQLPLDVFEDVIAQVSATAADLPMVSVDDVANDEETALSKEVLEALDDHYLSQSIIGHASEPAQANEKILLDIDLENAHVFWNLHDGYDWEETRRAIQSAIEAALAKAQRRKGLVPDTPHSSSRPNTASSEDESATDDEDEEDDQAVGDLLFNSIYIALPTGTTAEDARRTINNELAQAEADETTSQSTMTTRQAASTTTRQRSRGDSSTLQLGRSRTHKVRIELGGLSLHGSVFDADEGNIVNNFSVSLKDLDIVDNVSTSTWRKFLTYMRAAGDRGPLDSIAEIDVSTVKPVAGLAAAELVVKIQLLPLRLHVDQDTLEFLSRFFEFRDEAGAAAMAVVTPPADELFIQRLEVLPFAIQVDYKPKRLDLRSLRSGRTTELKNLFILEDANIAINHTLLYGINGIAAAADKLNDLWLDDIKRHQLPTVLAGVSSIRALSNLGSSLRELVVSPIDEYRRTGRLGVGNLRRGVTSFARTSGSEALRLGAKLAAGTQGVLERTERVATASNTISSARSPTIPAATSAYANPPANLREGMSQAVDGFVRNVDLARKAAIQLPRDLDSADGDIQGTARAAARTVPVALLRPLIGTTHMISKTLQGLRNQVDPAQRKLAEDKYK
ncbi:autophagy-related protein 2 [Savitreella phatthalungensis]